MASRREQILSVAARLFARHGYHGVSMGELGAAVGISGPALYRHFPGKDALLSEMLVDISERLLAGGEQLAAAVAEPNELLERLVGFQVEFATREPELIVVQDRDLANLPAPARSKVRKLQRMYVEIWVEALRRARPEYSEVEARIAAHAAFGLLNSTPHSRGGAAPELLQRMAMAALTGA